MRILLSIGFLYYRSGAELFVRDLALGLLRRGHSVVVYAPRIGDIGDELRSACVACVTDLNLVSAPPELIIGNTRHETVLALAQFAGVPGIFVCHDRVSAHGMPPRFERIQRYVAVDANTLERLVLESGIDERSTKIIQNGVDTDRFLERSTALPEKPRRAAIFSNSATLGVETAAIRAACEARQITLDVIGKESGNQAHDPAVLLPHYDLVFAKARCALEALAVGCAVILANQGMGMGDMVQSAQLDFLRRWNFGRRLLFKPMTAENVGAQIDRYDSHDAAMVTRTIRATATLDAMSDAFDSLAREVLEVHTQTADATPTQEWREFAGYASEQQALGFAELDRAGQLLAVQAHAAQELAAAAAQIQAMHETLAQTSALQAAAHAEALSVLHALRSSISWRLTSPIRGCAAILRRLLP